MSSLRTLILTAIVLTTALITPSALGGAWENYTWDGDKDQYWDTENSGTNWDHEGNNDPIPTFNDNVFFDGPAPHTTIELNGNRSVLSVNFSGSVDYTLEESTFLDTLKLVDGIITASGGGTHTISAEIKLEADGVWDIDGVNTWLRVTDIVHSSSGNEFSLTKTGAGTSQI